MQRHSIKKFEVGGRAAACQCAPFKDNSSCCKVVDPLLWIVDWGLEHCCPARSGQLACFCAPTVLGIHLLTYPGGRAGSLLPKAKIRQSLFSSTSHSVPQPRGRVPQATRPQDQRKNKAKNCQCHSVAQPPGGTSSPKTRQSLSKNQAASHTRGPRLSKHVYGLWNNVVHHLHTILVES